MSTADTLRAEAAKRILIKDGAYGTAIQAEKLAGGAYCGGLDLLQATRRATTTFSTSPAAGRPRHLRPLRRRRRGRSLRPTPSTPTAISQADYGAEHLVADINRAAARIIARSRRPLRARRTASRAGSPARSGRPTRPCRCRPTSTIPAYREVDFDTVKAVYREQIDALGRGRRRLRPDRDGVRHAERQGGDHGDARSRAGARPRAADHDLHDPDRPLSGRNLSGHTVEAFWATRPPCQAADHRPQLLVRRRAAAPASGRAVGARRHADHGLSQRRPAQRAWRI